MESDAFGSKGKQTEFNSSMATLKRIDSLIQSLHNSSFQSIKEEYIILLDRLYIEAQTKMTTEEKKTSKEYQEVITKLKTKWGNDLYKRNIGSLTSPIKNKKYMNGWSEIMMVAREYEIHIMSVMDSHNMLMKNQQTVDETPDDWE